MITFAYQLQHYYRFGQFSNISPLAMFADDDSKFCYYRKLMLSIITATGLAKPKELVQQVSEGKHDKVYCATQILDILEEPVHIRI